MSRPWACCPRGGRTRLLTEQEGGMIMFSSIVRRRVAAFLTAGAAAVAVLALAAPAGGITGGPQISPQQAGYTATGARRPPRP